MLRDPYFCPCLSQRIGTCGMSAFINSIVKPHPKKQKKKERVLALKTRSGHKVQNGNNAIATTASRAAHTVSRNWSTPPSIFLVVFVITSLVPWSCSLRRRSLFKKISLSQNTPATFRCIRIVKKYQNGRVSFSWCGYLVSICSRVSGYI